MSPGKSWMRPWAELPEMACTTGDAGARAQHLQKRRAGSLRRVVFLVVPQFLRDAVYRFIARNRYRWFGKEETCRVPTPELKARFLA